MILDSTAKFALFAQPRYAFTAAMVAALLACILLALWPREVQKSDVRVHNASNVALHQLIVGKTHYGDIGAGESTEYKSWGPAYPHPRVEFEVDGIRLRQTPIDHFSETALGAGRFTYILTVVVPKSEGDFSVSVVKD